MKLNPRTLFAGLLFAISQNALSSEADRGTLPYVNKGEGYHFRYPSAFRLNASEKPDSLLSLRDPSSYPLVRADVRVIKEKIGWSPESEASHEQLQRAGWPAVQKISGIPAQLYSFREGAAGNNYLTIGYVLRHGNATWRIEIVERTRNLDAYGVSAARRGELRNEERSQRRKIEAAFRSLVKSFRFDR